MNTLFENKNLIFAIKENIHNPDNIFYKHHEIKYYDIDNETISIVMTTSNRIKQTYFTLKSLSKSEYKNIQVIIVEDSDKEKLDINILKNYNFNIDLITIIRENKIWKNPLVNYNIGFQFIKGGKVVIQNAEVFHVGDVLNFVKNIENNNYYVFDVKATNNFEANDYIYKNENIINDISIFDNPNIGWITWYQSEHCNNRNYHFLTALTRETFDEKIKEFSYDLTMGFEFDDDDLVLKIILNQIKIINVYHNIHKIGGIHLLHSRENLPNHESNRILFYKKRKLSYSKNMYIDLTKDINEFDSLYETLKSI
jgi:hypothetical protein